jgi:THO complex subunit 2
MPDSDHPISKFWHKVLRVYFLPALPLIRGNAVCTVEIWNVIRQFETTVRWKLYGEWKTRTYTTHPELRVRAVQVDRESKGVLRRLSHNTIDTLSGTVAKIAHSNPCIFFANAVNQIMAYDNLASVVVQALRYATNMGFDVLVYIILDALANPHKERVKDDGVNTSDWLQSLFIYSILNCMWIDDVFADRSRVIHRDALPTLLRRLITPTEIHCAPALRGSDNGDCCFARAHLEDGGH